MSLEDVDGSRLTSMVVACWLDGSVKDVLELDLFLTPARRGGEMVICASSILMLPFCMKFLATKPNKQTKIKVKTFNRNSL